MSSTTRASSLQGPEDLERFVADHEVGVLDVLEAYDRAAAAYTVAASGQYPTTIVASATSPVPPRA
jgi:hypothetical protein